MKEVMEHRSNAVPKPASERCNADLISANRANMTPDKKPLPTKAMVKAVRA
jgi:hypothetical protein